MLWHAYIDESGDRGWTRRPTGTPLGARAGSSEHFSMTAVIVPDGSQSSILERWQLAAAELGRHPSDTLHWVNLRSHSQRLHLARVIEGLERAYVCSVVLSKWDVENAVATRESRYLYGWVLRLLIERLSWFGKRQDGPVVIHSAQVKGLPPRVIARYVESLRGQLTSIEWPWLHLPVRVNTPQNQRMLQVADAASGAVYAAFEWDDFGNTETRYLEVIRPRIWRPPSGGMQTFRSQGCTLPSSAAPLARGLPPREMRKARGVDRLRGVAVSSD